jgi:acetylornithine deacetylase/succinyl-diaminopimelate desuccinylase-like protein
MQTGRQAAIARAEAYFDDGKFVEDLNRRVGFRTVSQDPSFAEHLMAYLKDEIAPSLHRLGYKTSIHPNPVPPFGPFLIGRRIEGANLPTVLTYGHGDVVRGLDEQWFDGLSPWKITQRGDKLYGRGTADNKGQHSINLGALAAVIEARGHLGFNSTILIETGEETGSPGLHEFCAAHKKELKADILLASDGPRLTPATPTLVTGTRGVTNFELSLRLREGGHHSGNWGGLLASPGTLLSHALATIVDRRGTIQIPEWRPTSLTPSVRAALADVVIDGGEGAPEIDVNWGEPDLTPAERVFGWNSFEILALKIGNPDNPVNAIPPSAIATCQLRFVVGTDAKDIVPALRRHLDRNGFGMIEITPVRKAAMNATRLDPESPLMLWAKDSVTQSFGRAPNVLPNLGGSLPNDAFTDILGMPTIWVPHSYASCSQHAANEHMLAPLARQGLQIMTGLFFDVGEGKMPVGKN